MTSEKEQHDKNKSKDGRDPKKDKNPAPEEKQAKKKTDERKKSSGEKGFPVVGIGASAGGLEALEGFFKNIEGRPAMAFVIIQHRAAETKSVMPSLLEKYTDLDVTEIRDNTKIRPACIYINPPHKDISIAYGRLNCESSPATYGVRLPIDFFLRSLAADQGERSVCIILSGTGTDGTLGLKEIKAAGGMAMVQDEKQAKYSAMPRNAVDTGLVDFVLPVEKMPEQLMQYVKHPYLEPSKKPVAPEDKFENALNRIFRLVRASTGHDFSSYKRNTTRRRIERRMAVHQIDGLEDYIRFLNENASEVKTLFREMLITVTNFFRDPEAFEALGQKAVEPIITAKPLSSDVRVWVPGCATGEEAYSIAILFEETMRRLKKKPSIQIFATDVDSETIAAARCGIYPDSIAADVCDDRLENFFTQSDSTYKVKDFIREMIVFAEQDLIKDPPFSKLDMVCCRNVLIYMDAELQRKIIPLFHYILRPDGRLFLGTSETIGKFADLFSPVDNKWKIFRRKPQTSEQYEHPAIPLTTELGTKPPAEQKHQAGQTQISHLAEELILRDYSLPCVLVNENYDIVYFNADTSRFLAQPPGEPTTNILKMAKPELNYTLTIALHKASSEKKQVTRKNILIDRHDQPPFDIIVRPVKHPHAQSDFLLVAFDTTPNTEDQNAQEPQKTAPPEGDRAKVKALEQELASTREYLQTTIEELETSNEELKSSNEELQSTNEELQSTNEELETSREELQSTNEELRTVNAEHQDRIDQLARANDDLNNLLESTNIATVFLDTDLNIKRFTPESKELFRFIDTDAGRPLDNIVSKLDYEELEQDAKKVLDTLRKIEREVRTEDHKWLRVRIAPYRTTENIIDGVVITVLDISDEKYAHRYAQSIIETVREPLLVLDEDLRVISANRTFYAKFRVSPPQTEKKYIYHLGNGQWDIPKLRELLEEILPRNSAFEDFHVEHEFPDIGKKKMLLNARRIQQKDEQNQRILLAIEDITDKK
jgi:two-component system CheB/CheR fusion protein